MKIRLNASHGLVGYFEIPPFHELPDVTSWGDRTFHLRKANPPQMDNCVAIYDECFAVAIVTEPLSE